MQVPRRIRRLIFKLYQDCKCVVSFYGRLFEAFTSESGVKQGDPCAMVLFVLSFDPLLRWLDSHLSPIHTSIYGYCDDLGLACQDLLGTWSILSRCFKIIKSCSALSLNVQKTQCFITCPDSRERIMNALIESDNLLVPSVFQTFILYLGIYLGPGAASVCWKPIIKGYHDVVRFLRGLDAGLATTICLYNILCASKVSWTSSFVPPDADMLKAESHSLQALLRAPWNVATKSLLCHLKSIGFPVQFQSLSRNSIAGRARNGFNGIDNFSQQLKYMPSALSLWVTGLVSKLLGLCSDSGSMFVTAPKSLSGYGAP